VDAVTAYVATKSGQGMSSSARVDCSSRSCHLFLLSALTALSCSSCLDGSFYARDSIDGGGRTGAAFDRRYLTVATGLACASSRPGIGELRVNAAEDAGLLCRERLTGGLHRRRGPRESG
jgi:hypothetical protein